MGHRPNQTSGNLINPKEGAQRMSYLCVVRTLLVSPFGSKLGGHWRNFVNNFNPQYSLFLGKSQSNEECSLGLLSDKNQNPGFCSS
jgi:hypothetical protein